MVGVPFVCAPLALAAALIMAGYSQTHGTWWDASVQLAVLGGITIMIYGVNIYEVPFNAGNSWKYPSLVAAQLATGIVGAMLASIGYGTQTDWMVRTGHLLAFAGAILFFANLGLLFSQPRAPRTKTPPEQRTQQQRVDRLAIPFTIISSLMLIAGTGLSILLDYWTPAQGRWDLVWAHILLLGFFFPMASGTSYHVLGRWSGRDFRSLQLIRYHQYGLFVGLPAMAIGLGWDITWLLGVGAIFMAISLFSWAAGVIPVAWQLESAVHIGIGLALMFMAIGVTLGVTFALDAGLGARLRSTHVVANLFGFAGLLISGFGYRYIPLAAGAEQVRWPSLRIPQIVLMATGCALGMLFMGLRMYGHIGADVVLWPCVIGSIGMVLFATNAGATFLSQIRA